MKLFLLLFLIPLTLLAVPNKGKDIALIVSKANDGFIGEESKMSMILIDAQKNEILRELSSFVKEVQKDGDKSLSIFHTPKDVDGTKMLTWTHKNDDDDQWLFLPTLKKVKTISSSSKSGSFMGSEFSYEDLGSQEVEKYTYKFLKEDDEKWIIERYPVKKSGYTKQIVTISKKYKQPIEIQYFNRRSELLKTAKFSDFKSYKVKSKEYFRSGNVHMVNHLTKKESKLSWKGRKLGVIFQDNKFSKEGLNETF
jgi:hypothetical protein